MAERHSINNPKKLPEQSVLIELLNYEPETGLLFWRARDIRWFSETCNPAAIWRSWNTRYANNTAFTSINNKGYLYGPCLGIYYLAHRVAFKIVHGIDGIEIDHLDGNPRNNRLENLRQVTRSQQVRNIGVRQASKSGVIGVHWDPNRNKWRARIKAIHGVDKHLGYFSTFEQAVQRRRDAERSEGYHENHGTRIAHGRTKAIA